MKIITSPFQSSQVKLVFYLKHPKSPIYIDEIYNLRRRFV